MFETSRVGTGGFHTSLVGSGQPDPTRSARSDPTRKNSWEIQRLKPSQALHRHHSRRVPHHKTSFPLYIPSNLLPYSKPHPNLIAIFPRSCRTNAMWGCFQQEHTACEVSKNKGLIAVHNSVRVTKEQGMIAVQKSKPCSSTTRTLLVKGGPAAHWCDSSEKRELPRRRVASSTSEGARGRDKAVRCGEFGRGGGLGKVFALKRFQQNVHVRLRRTPRGTLSIQPRPMRTLGLCTLRVLSVALSRTP